MIVIPMAGLSSRFSAAGYDLPKFMLPLWGRTVFYHSVRSFEAYFESLPFLFIARGGKVIEDFILKSCESLGIQRAQVEILSQPTAGQAETVEIGLRVAGVITDMPVTIFNIDTFRPGFRFPEGNDFDVADGYLEVFKGSGNNWSYVKPAAVDSHRVAETAEKRPISDLCCTGLYHFSRASDFFTALARERAQPTLAELYVAPIYNHLIGAGSSICYHVVAKSEVVFCGVPSEYEALLASEGSENGAPVNG